MRFTQWLSSPWLCSFGWLSEIEEGDERKWMGNGLGNPQSSGWDTCSEIPPFEEYVKRQDEEVYAMIASWSIFLHGWQDEYSGEREVLYTLGIDGIQQVQLESCDGLAMVTNWTVTIVEAICSWEQLEHGWISARTSWESVNLPSFQCTSEVKAKW